jgi:phenylacetaldehyde dehydrogenase
MTVNVDEQYKLLIGGEWVAASDHYDIVDPNTTEVVGHAPEATVQQANDAAAAAREALKTWRNVPVEERCALLGRTAEILSRRIGELVPLVQAETGSTINVAETMQVPVCIERFSYYSKPVVVDEPIPPYQIRHSAFGTGRLQNAMVYRQPVGVVAAITPYNFAMGCTTIIKPAPQDPLAILKFGEIIEEAGFPPGVINIITGSGPETGAALVDSKDVNMISFTGSSAVGVKIMESGARTMKRLLMELGGKGALIMTEDCDLQAAVQGVASVWSFHSGQICTAPTRVLVHRSLYEQAVDALKAIAGSLKIGDATERDTIVGPLITETQRDRVEAMIKRGLDEGATLAAGGARPDVRGYAVAPTLLVDVKPDNYAVREEFFGPVVVVLPFDDEDEAVAMANDSDYGLYSYVFAGDVSRGLDIAKRLESGNVSVNGVQPHNFAPFGGFKMSGIGRDRGYWGLHAYSEIQAVNWAAV